MKITVLLMFLISKVTKLNHIKPTIDSFKTPPANRNSEENSRPNQHQLPNFSTCPHLENGDT